ncbi:hypothetical protein NW765_017626 [Fusarium oxysporum]|nr:hypothetical protein NW765_017626 [Fusarium oxysporum]KAJ4264137.1 hypothetical protein NW764_015945 [Fusarium oxysporum]
MTQAGDCRSPSVADVANTHPKGKVDSDEYGRVYGFTHIEEGDETDVSENQVPPRFQKKVIIVGAGISAIQQAAVLISEGIVKRDDIQLLDALDGFGGVWQKNKYPGCACDVPSMVYTSSMFVNKLYTHLFATREEIQSYYERFAHAYKLEECTRFNSFVKACHWDEESFTWKVRVQNKISQRIEHWVADIVIHCVGSLDRPKFGTTPGRENFKGLSWHTSSWRHDVDLAGKRVGIIGLGPSVAQIIPAIIDQVESVTVYVRTPPICLPRNDFKFSRLFRWALRWIPGFAWYQRQKINWRMQANGQLNATDGSANNKALNERALEFLRSQIKDERLYEILRPDAKYLCKRPLFLDNLYSSLAKPNCEVVRENLIKYTEEGVVSADKTTGEELERKFDVILFGTGFNVANFLDHVEVTGVGGLDLQDKWKAHPEALYGLATHNFPNMFMCFGPNSAHVWSSQQDIWEEQARFNAKMIREVVRRERQGTSLAVHPTSDAEAKYNQEVQVRQNGRFVWTRADCLTYYKNDQGWVTYTMPWTLAQFRKMLNKIFWNEWNRIERPSRTAVTSGYVWDKFD